MTSHLQHVSAISLFVEDLRASKTFYQEVFGVPVVFEDVNSVAVKFGSLIVNLLHVGSAAEIVEPGTVAAGDAGSRFQLSIWVPDLDAVCAQLRRRNVKFTGPIERPWGMRTVNFVDPSGHSWEIGQKMETR
jgi:catechol 2,3-dioxygenase-like lactoylglutathione lyase family enzyme